MTEAPGVAGRSSSSEVARGRAHSRARGRRDAEATAGSAGPRRRPGGLQAALAAALGRGRTRRAARASCRPRPGVGPAPRAAECGEGTRLGSPDGLTWRWIELHHLPCLDLFCSRSVPLLLSLPLPLLQGPVGASFRIISKKPKPKETEGYIFFFRCFLYFLFSLSVTSFFFFLKPPPIR